MAKFGAAALIRRKLRRYAVEIYRLYLNKFWGMHIAEGCAISLSSKLDKAHPDGVWIGKDTAVSFGAAILTHDYVRRMHLKTIIGERCQIGAHSIIFPGVKIGDGCIVAAGSVVMRDIPDGCLAGGNPARVMEKGLVTGQWGLILSRASADAPAAAPAPAASTPADAA
jgi:acetyltransferase-like isoleucine patch superfamily enzyme